MVWMRIKTTGEHLDSSTKTVRRLIKYGLPHHRLPNGTLLFNQNEVDRWVRESDPKKHINQIVDSVIEKCTENETN